MPRLSVVAAVVLATVVLHGAPASSAAPGLSWCAESTKGNIRVTSRDKPELSRIPVLVNYTAVEDNVVEEVFVRPPPTCGEMTQSHQVDIDLMNAMLVSKEGDIKLFWLPPDAMPLLKEVEDFCITTVPVSPEDQRGILLAKFCFPSAMQQMETEKLTCSGVACVRKCCPQNTVMGMGQGMCIPVADGEDWRPNMGEHNEVTMLYGSPRPCTHALEYRNHEYSILPSGDLQVIDVQISVDHYCIDTLHGSNASEALAMVCDATVAPWYCEWKHQVLKPILLSISAACLIIVWFVYVSVASLRRSNFCRCLISMVSALFMGHISLIILNIVGGEEVTLLCVVTGRLCHFALLAAYFWTNVLSIFTFIKLKSQMDDKWERTSVFVVCSLYAWCCPLVMVVVGEVLDAREATPEVPYMPHSCWFQDDQSLWAYLYGPMLVLLLINMGFFVGCVVLIAGGRRLVTFTPCADHHHICSSWLFVRLFIILGLLWMTEIVSWLFLDYCTVAEWIIDTINSVQGVLVFIVTVCCRGDLKVFHCGRPRLIRKGHDMVPTSTGDASEMTSDPLVK